MSPDWRQWDDPPAKESQAWLMEKVRSHRAVSEVIRHDPNRYTLRREADIEYEVFLTPAYILGEAEYEMLKAAHPEVDLIILASTWNSCSMDVKERAMEERIAVHTFKTLMQALYKDDDEFLAHGYQPTDREGRRLTRWS